jgi:hypothetical protein
MAATATKEREPLKEILRARPMSVLSEDFFEEKVARVKGRLLLFNEELFPEFPVRKEDLTKLSLFVDPSGKNAEMDLLRLPRDGRSGSLNVKFSDRYGNVYNYISIKGIGRTNRYVKDAETIQKADSGAWGLLNIDDAKVDWKMSNIFLKNGIRTSAPIAIIQIEELILRNGEKVSIDDLRKQGKLSRFTPVIYLRGFSEYDRLENIREMLENENYELDGVRIEDCVSRGAVFDLSEVSKLLRPLMYSFILSQLFSYLPRRFDEKGDKELRFLLVLEEAHLVFRKDIYDSGSRKVIDELENELGSFRKHGVGLVLITHFADQLSEGLWRHCQNHFVFKQDVKGAKLAVEELAFNISDRWLASSAQARLLKLGQGEACCLLTDSSRNTVGPFFMKLKPEFLPEVPKEELDERMKAYLEEVGFDRNARELSENAAKLLKDVNQHRFSPMVGRYERLNLGRRGGNVIKNELMRRELIEEERIVIGPKSIVFIIPTSRGLHYLEKLKEEGLDFWREERVSYEHRLFQDIIKRKFEFEGYNAVIEKERMKGGRADVAVFPTEKSPHKKRIAVEVTFEYKNALMNIKKDFKDGFDEVIGNPPWSAKIATDVNKILAKKYGLSEKNVNICALFVLGALKKLKPGGYFGFLLPKVFIKNEVYYAVRNEILNNYHIVQIIDFGQFPGVASDAIGLIIKNKKDVADIKISFFDGGISVRENRVNQNLFLKNPLNVFSLSLDTGIQKVLDTIVKKSKPLGEVFQIKRGIELGQKSLLIKCIKCGNYNEAETKYYGPIEKKCKKCGTKLDINKENVVQVSSPHKTKIYDEECVSGTQLQRYYIKTSYFVPTNLQGIDYKEKAFSGLKLLIKRISTKIEGTFYENKLLAFNTVYSIFNKDLSKNQFLFTLGILNSKLIHFFYEYSYNVGMNLTTQVTIEFLSKVPIRTIPESEQQPIIQLVEKMLSLNKRLNELGDKQTNERQEIEDEIKKTDAEIDELVYKLYGITEEEKKIIKDSLK